MLHGHNRRFLTETLRDYLISQTFSQTRHRKKRGNNEYKISEIMAQLHSLLLAASHCDSSSTNKLKILFIY